jgi:hypothetical protein
LTEISFISFTGKREKKTYLIRTDSNSKMATEFSKNWQVFEKKIVFSA